MSAQPRFEGLFDAARIPAALQGFARWSVWEAAWNAKRGDGGKWDKVPRHALAPHPRISTTRLGAWRPFEVALRALHGAGERFAGLGYVMTQPHGVVGVDLDHCVDEVGALQPWAQEVVEQLGSYAELSPSGTGVRIFCLAEIDADWVNHEQGIEVYAGHEARFLTVTGQRLPGTAADLQAPPAGALDRLAERFARERSEAQALLITLELPDEPDTPPDTTELDLPYAARDFLDEGLARGDRSAVLFSTAVCLARAGLSREDVYAVLAANPHAMGVALDHRRQDHDRALRYLWVEHAQKAAARAAPAVAAPEEFEVVAPAFVAEAKAPAKARFAFEQAAAFATRRPVDWLIKGVLPRADLGAIYGPSGSGKSFFVLDMCAAVARGLAWQGRTTRAGTVAYVCAEGAGGFALRLRAYAEFHGLDLADMPLHVLGDQPNLLQAQDVRDLVAALRALPDLALIVLDTLAQVTVGANENSAEDMGRALGHCRTLRRATGAMVVLVAHAGKDSDRGLRGWSGIKGALDVEVELERDDQRRWATVTKMKDGVGEGERFAFRLNTVELGQDADGEPVTSCVVAFAAAGSPEAQRPTRTPPKGEIERLVLSTLGRMLETTAALDGLSASECVGVQAHALWEAAKAELAPPAAGMRDIRRQKVIQAFERLKEKGHLQVVAGFVKEAPLT